MLPYIYCPEIKLDYIELTNIVQRRRFERIDAFHTHHRLVKDEPYLMCLQENYPFLAGVYNIYSLPDELEPHIDRDRQASFNIPIRYTETTTTSFYKMREDYEYEVNEKNIYYNYEMNSLTEIFSFTMTRPTIINTKIIHGVKFNENHNRSLTAKRTTISWNVLPEYSFADVVAHFNVGAVSAPTL
jgi:hypothetical protein